MEKDWTHQRVIIWGKTYPELSSKYYETVCTGGTLEDGRFVRLYPIPLRYLSDDKVFSKYQWVRLRMKKATDDPRPESFKVDIESIKAEDSIPADKQGWRVRAATLFKDAKYLFSSAEDLFKAREAHGTSLGFVRPKIIEKIVVEERPKEEYDEFMRKLKANEDRSRQESLFPGISIADLKALKYVSRRFKVHWRCLGPQCNGHKMSILDWEAYELARREGVDQAKKKIEQVLDLAKYDTGFFLGNFRQYPNTFGIGSIWYPKRPLKSPTDDLFELQ
jgi:hypothetical protein